MTRVFVFTNHKGGVGKSTSATNIALGITQILKRANVANGRVLLIDTDSQGHASLVTTGHRDYGADNSLYTVLMADRQNARRPALSEHAGALREVHRCNSAERHSRDSCMADGCGS